MNAVDIRNEIGGIPVPARFVPSMLRPVGKSTVPGTCLTPVFRVSFPVLSLPKVAPNSDGSPGAGAPTYSLE
ncbi:MAG: hypothetical protein N2688_15780, partial [Burkholderiaceae bacterium]|nr:hypothetical protein [Burkholderiaceae bacterium]